MLPPLLLLVLEQALWGGLAALGFAFLLNVPRRTLFGCALCGALGVLTRSLVVEGAGVDLAVATLAGASLVGLLALTLARFFQAPTPIFSVCGVIPMVPGSFAFRAMMALIRVAFVDERAVGASELYDAAVNLLRAALILIALAFGIAFPSLLFGRKKPVV